MLEKIDITSLLHSNVRDGTQILVYKISKESKTHFRQFVSVKVKKVLRKSQAEFCEKFRELRLRPNGGFLVKKRVYLDFDGLALCIDAKPCLNFSKIESIIRAVCIRIKSVYMKHSL